jgi:hypothetical protein
MGKMSKSEVVEWLNEIAERSREAYLKTGDDIYRKDNDCIMSALEIIGQSFAAKTDGVAVASCFEEDVRLLRDLKELMVKKQVSAKNSESSAKMMGRLMPGVGFLMPAVMGAVMDEADLLRRVYVRMGQLLEASR